MKHEHDQTLTKHNFKNHAKTCPETTSGANLAQRAFWEARGLDVGGPGDDNLDPGAEPKAPKPTKAPTSR